MRCTWPKYSKRRPLQLQHSLPPDSRFAEKADIDLHAVAVAQVQPRASAYHSKPDQLRPNDRKRQDRSPLAASAEYEHRVCGRVAIWRLNPAYHNLPLIF